jgi:hypothetical protein
MGKINQKTLEERLNEARAHPLSPTRRVPIAERMTQLIARFTQPLDPKEREAHEQAPALAYHRVAAGG